MGEGGPRHDANQRILAPRDSPIAKAADAAPSIESIAKPQPVRHKPTPSTTPGFFSIDSTPYAKIFIDGADYGSTPIYRRELPPGRHSVRAVSKTGTTKNFRTPFPDSSSISSRTAGPIHGSGVRPAL